jgi:hypothetical protein
MKNSILYSSLIIFSLLLTSCIGSNRSVPQRMDSFVDNAELKSDSYSAEDWEKSEATFEKLVSEYENSPQKYTDAEKKMAARAIGRYHALLLKQGIKESASMILELGNILPDYIDGFVDGLKQDGEDFDGTLNNLLDTAALEKSMEELGSAIEELFGDSDN